MTNSEAKATPRPWKAIEQDGQVNLVDDIGIIQAIVSDIETGNELANKLNNFDSLLEACRSAVAALTQNKTYQSDIDLAVKNLRQAIAKSEGR